MKRIIISICILTMLMLTGCTGYRHTEGDKISIVTTLFASYDFAKQITGDMADVKLLLKPGMETHSYEPSPSDIIMIEECDIFIYTGGENDVWLDRILSAMDNSEIKVIRMLDLVDKYEEETVEGMHIHKEEEDEDEPEWDEHVWTSPKNAVIISREIADAAAGKDPSNAEAYMDNLDAYTDELDKLDEEFRELVEGAATDEIIFGDRFPLRYFVEEYGLKYYAAFPGCASESEPSSKTVAFLIDKAVEDRIPVIFKIELSNGNIAKTIAGDSGAKVRTFYTCHNVSREDYDNNETYISLMRRNLKSLKEALY